MVIDTFGPWWPSLQNEPERRRFDAPIDAAERRMMSVACFVGDRFLIRCDS